MYALDKWQFLLFQCAMYTFPSLLGKTLVSIYLCPAHEFAPFVKTRGHCFLGPINLGVCQVQRPLGFESCKLDQHQIPSFLRLLKSTTPLFFHFFHISHVLQKDDAQLWSRHLGKWSGSRTGSGPKFEMALGSNKLDVQARIKLLWVKCCSIMFPTLQGEKMHINYDALMVDPTFWKWVFQHATAGQANMPSDISL